MTKVKIFLLSFLFIFGFNLNSNSQSIPGSFADLAERLMPSVVNISTTQTVVSRSNPFPGFEFPPGSPFGDMFKEFGTPQERPSAALGSGFIIDEKGIVVTNNHVIQDADDIIIRVGDKEIKAKVLAIDKTNDLAILQANITPGKVYPVSKEDVTLLQDIIVAGFPLGKKVSAAIKTHKGSVSALAGFGDNYSNFQTDATINQGNSGGPVMDEKGNVVGVAVALMSVDAGQNIFFAVKSSTLRTFANSNGLNLLPPNIRSMTNKDLGQLVTEGTVFLECWMTVAKIKQIIAQEENRKAFYSEFKWKNF